MIALAEVAIQSKIYESSASLVYRGIREEDARSIIIKPIVIKLLKQDYPSPQELTRYRQEYQITHFLNIELIIRKPETAQAHMETIDKLACSGLSEARRSMTALRSKLLEEGDLFSVFTRLTHQMRFSTDTHIPCEVIGISYFLPPDIENHLLRIGQEAVRNAIQYANAKAIHVELICEETQCFLRIRDDEQGFDVDQISPDKGFGLLGISERVEQIGGERIIKSQPGWGTNVVVVVNRG